MAFVRKCDKYQRFSNILRSYLEKLTSVTSPWSFIVWGIDLIDPLPIARPAFKYTVVAVNYFTKWAKAKPLATISNKKVQDFVWEAITCQYDIPQEIVSNNGMQFDSKEFREFCNELGIKKNFSSVDHSQTNGQVKAVKKIIKHNLKTKLEEHKKLWANELPKMLWAYRTTSRTSRGKTPFSLAYGVEAMIPVEVGIPSLRRETYNPEKNHALLCYELDLLEDKCDLAALRTASYKLRFERYFNSKVKERRLRKVLPNTKKVNSGVLRPNWEGPYVITEVLRPGTYKLKRLDGKIVPQSWNAELLRPCYQ